MRVHDLLDFWAERIPDEVYLADDERRMTWREVRDWSRQIGHWLSSRLGPGARFALLDRNSLEMIAVYYGASRAGVVPVPLDFRLGPAEWALIVDDAGCSLAIVHADYADALSGAAPQVSVVTIGVQAGRSPDLAAELAACPTHEVVRDVSLDAAFQQVYAAGATGRPERATVSQRAACFNAIQSQAGLEVTRLAALCATPLSQPGAVTGVLALTVGGCSIRVMRDFDPASALRILSEDRIQAVGLSLARIETMVAHPAAAGHTFKHLELITYDSGPMAAHALGAAMELFGCEFAQLYGLSEVGAVATILSRRDHDHALRRNRELLVSAGRPVLGTQVRVIDADDREVGRGETGEVVVRGPQLMSGSWGQGKASGDALRGGWVHTGDAGRLDRDGYLFVSGRVEDSVTSGGEKPPCATGSRARVDGQPTPIQDHARGLAGHVEANTPATGNPKT